MIVRISNVDSMLCGLACTVILDEDTIGQELQSRHTLQHCIVPVEAVCLLPMARDVRKFGLTPIAQAWKISSS